MSIVGILLFGLFYSQHKIYGEENSVSEVKKTLADYMTPKASEAIRASQGTLVASVATWSRAERGHGQATVIDAERGLILSVAHGVSKYPDIAMGPNTEYLFILNGVTYTVEFKFLTLDADLAIFRITDTDKSKLKSVKFAEEINLFEEYYSLRETVSYQEGGVTVTGKVPWKAKLVSIHDTFINIEKLIFDRAIIFGFSGACVFNKDGEAIGMMQGSLKPGGFSTGLSAKTIVSLIDDYKAMETYQENLKKLEEESSKSAPPSDETTSAEASDKTTDQK